ncbi:MAG: hypothetical protein ACRDKZ_07765 [Actinomycetota bacterium]
MSPRTMILPPNANLSDGESKLVDVYNGLIEVLRDHGDELPPFAHRNALKAAAALWQVMNGLDLDPGQLYDVGA